MSASATLALVGSSSVLGGDLKDLLAAAGYPGRAIELLDLDDQIGLVTKYGDEARVVLEAAEDSVREHRLVCFCGDPVAAQRFAPVVVDAGGTVIDCTSAHGSANDVTLIDAAGSPTATGFLAVPHAGTLLLAALSATIRERFVSAAATLLLPASELSDPGTEELATQATAMLNFGEGTEETFGRRLAFDAWPDATPPAGAAETIRTQLAALGAPAPALTALRASVFHGTAASIYIPGAAVEELRDTLRSGGIRVEAKSSDGELIDSPTRVAGRPDLHVCGIRGEADGSWLWALMDNHHAAAATAVAAIRPRLPLPEPTAD